MIPRRIFWLLDLIILALAFFLAYAFVPTLRPFLVPGGFLQQQWAQALAIHNAWIGVLPPRSELLWVLCATAPVTLAVLAAIKDYGRLLNQSPARIFLGGCLAPLVGLSFGTLVMASLKANPVSRLFLFSFALFSAAGLILYRLLLRNYFRRRQAAGSYAVNVLLIGLPECIAWMARYFSDSVSQSSYRLIGFLSADQGEAQSAVGGPAAGPQSSLPNLGYAGQLGELLINQPIHEVIAIQPASGGEWVAQVVRDCDYFGVMLRIVPEALLFGERRVLETLYPFEALHLPAVVLAPPHWDSGRTVPQAAV